MAESRKWTPQQWDAITSLGQSLLVSAAAGSGKTATLAERCAFLVCDAPNPCEIDQLLVVTFTDNAAAEMRGRIQEALRRRMTADPSARPGSPQAARLRRQVALAEHAQVSTLHGFCARLLRQNFHRVGLDPNFQILDADESHLIRGEVVREMFDQRYDSDAGGDFRGLIDDYGDRDGRDERLMDSVVATHSLLCSLVDPRQWLDRSAERLAEAADHPLEDSHLGNELLRAAMLRLSATSRQCRQVMESVSDMPDLGKYAAHLAELLSTLESWERTLDRHGLDRLAQTVAEWEKPRLPTLRGDTPGKELAQTQINLIKDEMSAGQLQSLLRFSSDQWRDGLRRVLPHARRFLDLVDRFGRQYAQAKRRMRGLDFNDLERFTLQVLSDGGTPAKPSAVARIYHGQFRYVLVDEYQDINEIQDAILGLVSHECLKDEKNVEPNLFCVGDVKQSIFRFRLAEPKRFLDREKKFRQAGPGGYGRVIDLQENFRSRGPLLEAINGVFRHLMTESAVQIEYDQSHQLRCGQEFPTGAGVHTFPGAPIELHLLPSEAAESADADDPAGEWEGAQIEASFLAHQIRRMMGGGGGPRMQVMQKDSAGVRRPRELKYGDIVILLRALKFRSDAYASVLREAGIPVHNDGGAGFFQAMEIRDMLALLNLLDNQRQDLPLAAVLRSPISGLAQPDNLLARIRLAYGPLNPPDQKMIPFHEAAARYAKEKEDDLAVSLQEFFARLEKWRELARQRPLAELIWTIYDQSGYLAFCSGLADGQQRCANLIALHERARQFGSFLRQGLYRFLRFVETLDDEKDPARPSVASQAEDAVRIMSIHRAKGLEFPVVLLPSLGKKHNFTDCNGPILADRDSVLGMEAVDEKKLIRYDSLASILVSDRLRQQTLAEEMRLLYVAMTRAQEHLVLVGISKAKTPAKCRELWAGHRGAFPDDVVLAGQTMLDWLIPVAVAAADGPSPPLQLIEHAATEVADWIGPRPAAPEPEERLAAMIDLRPLTPPPPPSPVADAVVARLQAVYPHQPFTTLAASQSVTQWTQHGRNSNPPPSPPSDNNADSSAGLDRLLDEPVSLKGQLELSPADRGTIMHRVLESLDFSACHGEAEVRQLVADLTARQILTPAEAAAVDIAAIVWLLGSPTGELLRQNFAHLRREVPIYFSVPPESFPDVPASADADDRVMVRGRIDALIADKDQLVLLDYKTDDVPPQFVAQRAEEYRPQVDLYRRAIERIARRPVTAAHLVFLTARRIVMVP